MSFVYRLSGEYVGFFVADRFFDFNGQYLGWIDKEKRVWSREGHFIGERKPPYILKNCRQCDPVRQTPPVPPIFPTVPSAPGSLLPKPPSPGWKDALEQIGRLPTQEDFYGTWMMDDSELIFSEDQFLWRQGDIEQQGLWSVRGSGLSVMTQENEAVRYSIIEYTPAAVVLREVKGGLAFTLERKAES